MFYFQPDHDSFIFGPFKNNENVKETDLVVLRSPDYETAYTYSKISNSGTLYTVEYDRIPENFMILPLCDEYFLYDKENQTLNIPVDVGCLFSEWTLPVEFVEDTNKPKCLFQLDEVIGLYLDGDMTNNLDKYLYKGLVLKEPHSIILDSKLEKIHEGSPFGEEGIFAMDISVIDTSNLKSNLNALTSSVETP